VSIFFVYTHNKNKVVCFLSNKEKYTLCEFCLLSVSEVHSETRPKMNCNSVKRFLSMKLKFSSFKLVIFIKNKYICQSFPFSSL